MNIVSIGGGEKDKAMRHALSVANNQNVLLVPSACSTEASYNKKVGLLVAYFQRFSIPDVQILHGYNETPSHSQIEDLVHSSGLAYVIGGNTPYMLDTIKSHGSDRQIAEATKNGMVLSGTSAGAILPFHHGQVNPAKHPEAEAWDFEYVDGLGLIDATIGVHADKKDAVINGHREKTRGEYLEESFAVIDDTAIAVDEGAAVSVTDTGLHVITAHPKAKVRILQNDETPLLLGDNDTYEGIKAC